MTRFVKSACYLALFTLPAATAAAQACVGTASFASGPARLGVGIDFAKDAKQYGAQIAFGKPGGPFAAGSIGRIDVDDTDESATSYGAELGYSLNISGKGSLEVCPILGLAYASAEASDGGVTVDVSSRTFSAGFAIGGVAASTPTFAFVPSIGLAYANQNVELESGGVSFDVSEDFGVITLVPGLVFNQRITVRPNVAFPVGLDDSDPTYGIGISFNFGSPSANR